MKRKAIIHALTLLTTVAAAGDRPTAQTRPPDMATLRSSIERRFDVLPLRDGVALRPKDTSRRVRSVEVAGGLIAIDGQPVTGIELREKLGTADANLVLELSYLSEDDRRLMFSSASAPASGALPTPELRDVPRVEPPRIDFPRIERRNRGRRDGGYVQIGRSITIREDEIVDGDVVAVGGSVSVDGEVRGDVVSVGGSVTLGPKASVSNNVVAVGGHLSRDPGSRIGGRIQEVGFGSIDFGNFRRSANPLWLLWGSMVGAAFALVFTLTRLAILCLLAALVVLFGRGYVERTGDRAATDPVKAGAIGLLAQLLFLPVLIITIVVLVMTIIGIPLLLLIPFLILGLAIVGLVGFTGVAYRLGGGVMARFGWPADNPYLTTIAGIVVVLSPLLVARVVGLAGVVMVPFTFGLGLIGMLLEYLVWTVGFGAVALMRFSRPPATTTTAA